MHKNKQINSLKYINNSLKTISSQIIKINALKYKLKNKYKNILKNNFPNYKNKHIKI